VDFGSHLSGAEHDTVSFQAFANFAQLLAATHDNSSGDAVIKVDAHDTSPSWV
jgi:hypothetical protein